MRIEMLIGGASIGATVFLPDRWRKHRQTAESCRVMWLLHDKFDVSEDWLAYTQAEIFAGERNMALVAPSMSGGRYADWIDGCTWESFFPQFRAYILEMFPIFSRKKEDQFIFGFGQGGFAAIKYALLSPESYGMVYSANYNDWPAVETFTKQKLHQFKRAKNKLGYPKPDILIHSPENIPWFAEQIKETKNFDTKIFMVCEADSHEFPRNQEVATSLSSLGFDVTWEEYPKRCLDDKTRPIARFPNWRFCNEQLEKAVAIADGMSVDRYQE